MRPAVRDAALDFFAEHQLYPFTVNAFPYGRFHQQEVKATVYAPDWRTEQRVSYTMQVADVLASLLPSGAVSFLYYADRLNQMPLGVIGIAIGTALLPVLARHVAAGDDRMVRHYLSRALEFSLLLGLPAAVALGMAGAPIVAVLFQRGAFGPAEAQATAMALAAYAVGIPAYVIVKSLNAAFFARHDTVTPVRVAIIVTVATALLALLLMPWLGHVGIALSTGLTAWLDVGLLVAAMRKRRLFDLDDRLIRKMYVVKLAPNIQMVVPNNSFFNFGGMVPQTSVPKGK